MDNDFSRAITSIQKSIEKADDNVKYTEGFLNRLYALESKLLTVQTNISKAISQAADDSTYQRSVQIAYEDVSSMGPSILQQSAASAADLSSEFNDPLLKDNLVAAAGMPESIEVKLAYNGLASTVTVDIKLNDTAGSLEDWGKAVASARKTQGNDPLKASKVWEGIFKGRNSGSPWQSIQETRMGLAGRLAPFWEILDKGQANVTLSSSYGGYPTPSESPKNFTDDTISQIEELFEYEMTQIRIGQTELITTLKEQLQTADSMMEQLQAILDEVSYALFSGVEIGEETPRDVVQAASKAESRYSELSASINHQKLFNLTNELVLNGTITSYKVTGDGRVEVTRSGANQRARVNINVIRQFLAEG